jgi:hypothetical protein
MNGWLGSLGGSLACCRLPVAALEPTTQQKRVSTVCAEDANVGHTTY